MRQRNRNNTIIEHVICMLLLSHAVAAAYKIDEDASWALYSNKLSNDILGSDRQGVYDQFMNNCRSKAGDQCDRDENFRMQMNMYQPRSMKNFTKLGFAKVRAPAALMELVEHFWVSNQDRHVVEWSSISPYHNTWDSDPTVIRIEDTSMIGGGMALRAAFGNHVRSVIEEWTGMKQVIASVYGIRSYHNGSILAPHVDRNPLISSAILNIAQDVDEDWPLEVYDHNGVAHNVTMRPGDLVLYESHSVVHGRPFPLNGRFYANLFVHFEPLGPLNASESEPYFVDGIRYPPYLIPGSSWEREWRDNHPQGWNLLSDVKRLVSDGDNEIFMYAIAHDPSLAHGTDQWKPIHEAVRYGHYDIVHYLVTEHNVDLMSPCEEFKGKPLQIAYQELGKHHAVTHFLLETLKEKGLYNEKDYYIKPDEPEVINNDGSEDGVSDEEGFEEGEEETEGEFDANESLELEL